MAKRPKRQRAIKRLNLSDHTLDINIRRCNYNKFNFSEIEDYVHALTGSRDYQYDAIKQVMTYLWGGAYKSIIDLAKENHKKKLQIQQRFVNEDIFLQHIPLPDMGTTAPEDLFRGSNITNAGQQFVEIIAASSLLKPLIIQCESFDNVFTQSLCGPDTELCASVLCGI